MTVLAAFETVIPTTTEVRSPNDAMRIRTPDSDAILRVLIRIASEELTLDTENTGKPSLVPYGVIRSETEH